MKGKVNQLQNGMDPTKSLEVIKANTYHLQDIEEIISLMCDIKII